MLLCAEALRTGTTKMHVHCWKVQVYRCDSAGQPLTHFSLEYSVLPPNVFQKCSGSEPSLNNNDCFSGCKNSTACKPRGEYFTISLETSQWDKCYPYKQLIHHPVKYIMFAWWRKASNPGKERSTVLQNVTVWGIKRTCDLHLLSDLEYQKLNISVISPKKLTLNQNLFLDISWTHQINLNGSCTIMSQPFNPE